MYKIRSRNPNKSKRHSSISQIMSQRLSQKTVSKDADEQSLFPINQGLRAGDT